MVQLGIIQVKYPSKNRIVSMNSMNSIQFIVYTNTFIFECQLRTDWPKKCKYYEKKAFIQKNH